MLIGGLDCFDKSSLLSVNMVGGIFDGELRTEFDPNFDDIDSSSSSSSSPSITSPIGELSVSHSIYDTILNPSSFSLAANASFPNAEQEPTQVSRNHRLRANRGFRPRPHECEKCGHAFTRRSHLLRHAGSVHRPLAFVIPTPKPTKKKIQKDCKGFQDSTDSENSKDSKHSKDIKDIYHTKDINDSYAKDNKDIKDVKDLKDIFMLQEEFGFYP